MSVNRTSFGWAKHVLIGTSMLCATPLWAQAAAVPAPSALSDSAMGNLVRLLVKQRLHRHPQLHARKWCARADVDARTVQQIGAYIAIQLE